MRSSLLMLCVAGLTSTIQGSDGLDGPWAGVTDAFGRAALVEARFERSPRGLRGSYQRFADAGSGYDAPSGSRAPIDSVALDGDTVRFSLRNGAREMPFAGTIRGGVLSGRVDTPNGKRSLTLRRVRATDERALAPYVGTYRQGDALIAVTWREFGGLRIIDLATGTARSLASETDTSFLDLGSVVASPAAPARVVLASGGSGPAQSLRFEPGADAPPPWSGSFARDDAFTQERVEFTNEGVSLAGTLLLPRQAGVPDVRRQAAIVLVHGSGPIYRTALFERAAHFARRGYAVLIYDKRGTGRSTGTWQGASFEQLASDALAAVHTLRARSDIDARRIGLQGHSQAGYVIPIAAAESTAVAFALIVSGGPLSTLEQSLYDKENDLHAGGFSAEETRTALDLMRRVFAYVRDSVGDRAQLEADYHAAKRQRWFEVTDLPNIPGIPSWDVAPPAMHAWRDELRFDGLHHVARMKIPTFVLLGSEDKTVPAARVAELWRTAWERGGHPANRVEIVPGADHGLRVPDASGRRPLASRYFTLQEGWLESLGIVVR